MKEDDCGIITAGEAFSITTANKCMIAREKAAPYVSKINYAIKHGMFNIEISGEIPLIVSQLLENYGYKICYKKFCNSTDISWEAKMK